MICSNCGAEVGESIYKSPKGGLVCARCLPGASNTASLLFWLLLAILVAAGVAGVVWMRQQAGSHDDPTAMALDKLNASPAVEALLGKPIQVQSTTVDVAPDPKASLQEGRYTLLLHGPKADGVAHVTALKSGDQPWNLTALLVVVGAQNKSLDVLTGVTTTDGVSSAPAQPHKDAPAAAADADDLLTMNTPAPRMDATFPCIDAPIEGATVKPELGDCPLAAALGGPVDRMETDLRSGKFVLRETDLALDDDFKVPLTRTYASQDWVHHNPDHAFGKNTNHPFDVAPVGSRNPYTFQLLVLEDGNFMDFVRITPGSGYRDAVYRHSETPTRFYKALQRWNGRGWTMSFHDGSSMLFPDSYSAINMAQGAATEIRNAQGERLQLNRDGRGNLAEIRTPHGHWIHFVYDDRAHIREATDDAGHWAKYNYTSDGMLKDVALSTGHERHFRYGGRLMTEVTDEAGHALVKNTYRGEFLEGQMFANHALYLYEYDSAPSRRWVQVAHVTMPDNTHRAIPVEKDVPDYIRHPRKSGA